MREKITDTIFIGFITVFSYITYYVMSVGYYSYLEIPLNLISIEFTNVIGTMASLIIVSLILVFLAEGLISFFSIPNDNVYQNLFKRYFMFIIFFGFISLLTNFDKVFILAYLIILVFGIIIDFVSPIITERKTKGYRKKLYSSLSKNNKKDNSTTGKSKMSILSSLKRIDRDLPKIISLIFLILISSIAFGSYNAKQISSFTVLNYENVNYQIYGTYEGKYITRKLDNDYNIVEANVYLIEINNQTFFKVIKNR